MEFENKKLRDVAEIARQIMVGEELKGGQVKLDKNHNGKIDGQDFKILKGQKKMKENLEDFSLEEIEAFMMSEDFEQLDELSKQTLKSYRVKSIGRDIDFEKKGYKAANQDGGAGSDRADQLFNKSDLVTAARKRAQEKMRKEDVQELDEGVMDKMSLSALWHKHGHHHYVFDQGHGHGYGSSHHNDQAMTAIENHVRKHHGNKVADDMVHHSELRTAADEYLGGKDARNAESTATKLRAKHKIQGDMHGNLDEEVEQIEELKKSTMGSYVKKASSNLADRSFDHGESEHRQYGMGDDDEKDKEVERDEKKIETRKQGINRAATKLSKEEVELDEVSLKTATSAYVKRMGDDGPNEKSSIAKATKTMDHIANKHGVKGVARATKTADDKYGLNDPVHNPRKAFVKQIMANVKKEEIDQAAATILEYESKDGKFVHRARPGVYGGTKDEKHAVDTLAGPKTKELKAIESEKKKKMSEMVATYKEQGLKGLFEALKKEEVGPRRMKEKT